MRQMLGDQAIGRTHKVLFGLETGSDERPSGLEMVDFGGLRVGVSKMLSRVRAGRREGLVTGTRRRRRNAAQDGRHPDVLERGTSQQSRTTLQLFAVAVNL